MSAFDKVKKIFGNDEKAVSDFSKEWQGTNEKKEEYPASYDVVDIDSRDKHDAYMDYVKRQVELGSRMHRVILETYRDLRNQNKFGPEEAVRKAREAGIKFQASELRAKAYAKMQMARKAGDEKAAKAAEDTYWRYKDIQEKNIIPKDFSFYSPLKLEPRQASKDVLGDEKRKLLGDEKHPFVFAGAREEQKNEKREATRGYRGGGNYYEILGIPTNATKSQIKAAYRELAMKYHPDRNKSPEAADIFRDICDAYAVLMDDDMRREYDARLFGRNGGGQTSQPGSTSQQGPSPNTGPNRGPNTNGPNNRGPNTNGPNNRGPNTNGPNNNGPGAIPPGGQGFWSPDPIDMENRDGVWTDPEAKRARKPRFGTGSLYDSLSFAKARGEYGLLGIGKMASGKNLFSKNVCPNCGSPMEEIAGRHYCSRIGCIYGPKECPFCYRPLDVDKDGFKCTNKDCDFNKDRENQSAKVADFYKKIDHGVKTDHLENMHRKKTLSTVLRMTLGVIPMIFPGGFAGVLFLLAIWSASLELFFPGKPKHEGAMILKSFGRFFSILLAGFGFLVMGFQFVTLLVFLLGYYSLPSGIAEHAKYRQLLGWGRTGLAIGLAILAFTSLGGPPQFRIALSFFLLAYLMTLPIRMGGERLTGIIFLVFAIMAMYLGLLSLGALGNPMVIVGFTLIVIGLFFYYLTKLPTFKRMDEEEEEEKKRVEKEERQEAIENMQEEKLALENRMEKRREKEEEMQALPPPPSEENTMRSLPAPPSRPMLEDKSKK